MSRAYYNEHDPVAAAWLRELIKQGHIPEGDVDERSIEDVRPEEVRHYTQCHFFAGVGVWAYALRQAGWSDDRPVWTGSCPCQPFSAAGQGVGFADERHLWPAFFHLIQHGKRPEIPLFGEQVESKNGRAWLDLVYADLEGAGHTCWPLVLPAAGIGAPNIRHRLWFIANGVAYTGSGGPEMALQHIGGCGSKSCERETSIAGSCGASCRMADTERTGSQGRGGPLSSEHRADGQTAPCSTISRMADTPSLRCDERRKTPGAEIEKGLQSGSESTRELAGRIEGLGGDSDPGPTNGFWRDADWLGCRDEKWRPVEPCTFPLVDGPTARVGRLRGYGNAINAEAAKEVIRAYMEAHTS